MASPFANKGISDSILNKPVEFNEIEQVLIDYAKLIADDASDNLNKINKYGSDTNASGTLQQSINISPVSFMGGNYSIEILMADYYKWVNDGRSPGKRPPISAIKNWIIKKQLRLDDGGFTKKGYKREGTLLSASKKKVKIGDRKVNILDAVSYKIAAKIGKYGTQPTNFLTDAVNKNKESLYDAMAKALKNDVILMINNSTRVEAK
jgi:hypothetical protein